ncbi:MAG: TIGR02757 family protein [Candidatus Hydrogenedentes bacterium]|nr:TIGR02757 family protein [Candidatus Hydrogenedentota bacterium]
MRQSSNSTLRARLEALYARYNRSVAVALERIPRPRRFIAGASASELRDAAAGFGHRYASQDDLAALLIGISAIRNRDGSLGASFAGDLRPDHSTVLPALCAWTERLRSAGGKGDNCLLPAPLKGSACKRLNLYLRWMVRRDAVDPGGWASVPASKLIVPIDTHMHRIAVRLGFTKRKQADMKTALEVTEQFRRITPEDPVRYDFALTRLGIRDDTDMEAFLGSCSGLGRE